MINQYEPLIDRPVLAQKISEYVNGLGYFTEYVYNSRFEDEIKKFLKVKHCSTTNNGTISLSLALLAYGIKPYDRVIVPNITMIATAFAVKLIGADAILFDINDENGCLDLDSCIKAIEIDPKIKAVIYVTLNGRSHKIEQINKFKEKCKEHNVKIVYDNAQSFGSYNSNCDPISCFGDGIGSFSFSMPKIITTGQGGCLVTNNDELALKIVRLKDFGRGCGGNDIHDHFGINSKFTEIQAIMGLNQLESIYDRINSKLKTWYLYKENLLPVRGVNVSFLHWAPFVPWFVDVYVERREELKEYLHVRGIQTRIMYPQISSQKVSNGLGTFKNSKEFAEKGLWLPSSINIKKEDIEFVCETIRRFYETR